MARSTISIAGLIMVPFGGLLADWLAARTPVGRFYTLAIGLGLAGILLLPLMGAQSAIAIGVVLLASSFGKGIFDGCIYSTMHDVVPSEARASAVGLMTMSGLHRRRPDAAVRRDSLADLGHGGRNDFARGAVFHRRDHPACDPWHDATRRSGDAQGRGGCRRMSASQPAALLLKAPRELAFEPLELAPLGPDEVRIRTLYSGVSAGTELSQYRGTNPFMNRRWDETARLFVASAEPSWRYPVRNLGYEEAGEIVEVGSAVTDVRVGQRVFGTWGHRTHHVATQRLSCATGCCRRTPIRASASFRTSARSR